MGDHQLLLSKTSTGVLPLLSTCPKDHLTPSLYRPPHGEHYEWQTPDEDSTVPKPELGAEQKRMEREAETWQVPYHSVG